MQRFCKTCGFADKTQNICLLIRTHIDLELDGCSRHTKEPEHCELCNSLVIKETSIIVPDNEDAHLICKQCYEALKTCQACPNFQICPFETDPNPLPKQVTREFRQGNMVGQTTVRNEERVKAICYSCVCWNDECGCLKQFNIGCNKKPDFWTSRKSSQNTENS